MARGMSRRGLSVSSPSEAAPSKPRKREEPVDGSQGDSPESDSVRHREGGQGEFLSTRGRAAYYPGEDDYDKDQIDSAIATQKRRSRRRPRSRVGFARHRLPPTKMSSGRKAPTTQFGASTTSNILLAAARLVQSRVLLHRWDLPAGAF